MQAASFLIVRRLSYVVVCQHFQNTSYLKSLDKFYMEYPVGWGMSATRTF